MRLVIIGGHLTPAYSLVEIARVHQDSLLTIGSSGSTSLEARELTQLGSDYRSIFPTKFDRYHKFISILKFPFIVIPIIQSIGYLHHFKPDVVISFGSFNALPVCVAAYLLHIPIVVHEQTRSAGLANRMIGHIAVCCAVSYAESSRYFPKSKIIITGNLLRSDIWNPPTKNPFNLSTQKPILYITGGNQGSRIINQIIVQQASFLSEKYQVMWQYGKQTCSSQPFPSSIVMRTWFSSKEIAWLLSHAHLIVTRGGANTTAEIMATGKPSVIIPLPYTSQDEQTKNALMITTSGAGILINQADLSGVTLISALNDIEMNYTVFLQHAQLLKKFQDSNAAQKLYLEIVKVVERT